DAFAVLEAHGAGVCEVGPILGARAIDDNHVSGLQGIPAPAVSHQYVRTSELTRPMNHFAGRVFNVEVDPRMRIDPIQPGNGAFELDRFRAVELRGKRVM